MTEFEEDFFAPGEHFHGYVIERLIGKGGVGAVYLARHELLDTLYAIKILYPKLADANPSYIGRFLREAKIATRVHHPNMVAVHDCGHDSDKHLYYLVMDYVVCGDLRQAIAFSGCFKVEEALNVIYQAASALDAMQRYGVVHRDIKPENILVQADGMVKLVDLGIAKATNLGDTTMTTSSHAVFGTPAYVSPEQAQNAAMVDTRADVYSLGMVLFELLAGVTPYKDMAPMMVIASVLSDAPTPDITAYAPHIPRAVAKLVMWMTEKNRDKRLHSPAAVMAEIDKLGYKLRASTPIKVEYTPTSNGSGGADDIRFDTYCNKEPTRQMETIDLAAGDPEILEFLKKRKRTALIKKGLLIALAGLAVAILICVIVSR